VLANQSRPLLEKECNARRHLPVGRPFPSYFGFSGIFSRIGRGSEWSINNSCASDAGPRLTPIFTTSIFRNHSDNEKTKLSPISTL